MEKEKKCAQDEIVDIEKKYTEEEKTQIKELFEKASDLNAILDKYDIESEFSWQEYFESVSRYFAAS